MKTGPLNESKKLRDEDMPDKDSVEMIREQIRNVGNVAGNFLSRSLKKGFPEERKRNEIFQMACGA